MRVILPLLFCLSLFQLNAQDLYFPPVPPSNPAWETVDMNSIGWCSDKLPDFETYLVNSGTYGLIILKDGKIVHETYPNGSTNLATPWEGASKPLGSVLAKLVEQLGYITSLSNKASDYLGTGWSSAPQAKEDLITIKNLMNFTTGLNDDDPNCITANCLSYEADAGTRWGYHNGTFKLLLDVIKNQPEFGNQLNFAFLSSGLFQNDGPGLIGSFNDNAGANTTYSGTTRDAARFGLFMLARGKFGNETVINDDSFFDELFSAGNNPNKSYGQHFWLNGQQSHIEAGSNSPKTGRINENAPSDMISAIGKGGQFIDIIPSHNMVVIRQGLAFFDAAEVPFSLHREFWGELSKVACNVVNVNETPQVDESLAFPNPFTDKINLSVSTDIESVRLIDVFGKVVLETKGQSEIEAGQLPKGIYILEATDKNQIRTVKKMIKE